MASDIPTCVDEVKGRINITGDGAEPSDGQVEDYLRLAFKNLIGTLPPILHTTLTLGNNYAASLTHDRLYFVSVKGLPLFPWEYSTSGDTVVVQPTAADRGDTIQVWYSVAPEIVTGTTDEIDTTCIFGQDWLEELAVLQACMQPQLRQAAVSASQSPQDYASMYRVIGERYEAEFAAHRMTWDMWFQQKNMELQARSTNGPQPVRYSGHAGYVNRSSKRNWLTGAGDSGVPNG